MGSVQTLVCVKEVKQEVQEDWDESMLLPGDIIEGIAECDSSEFFMPTKARSELRSQLAKLNRRVEGVWVQIRRGNNTIKLRACIVQDRSSKLQRRYTIRAASDNRHIAVLGDLTLEQCTELQEMSRKVVNVESRGFNKKGVKYDWKKKADMYLPDQRSTVVSSVLFMPLLDEQSVEETTARSMAWFSAAVSSGVPLVFVNIQTEQIVTSEKASHTGKELRKGKQHNYNTTIHIVNGIRLWCLPGAAEVSIVLRPELEETRFGMDIKRTEEGFICVNLVMNGSAADRAGMKDLHEQASEAGYLVVISRLGGKSALPSTISPTGLIHCCDNAEVKGVLATAIGNMDEIQLHIMGLPAQKARSSAPSPPVSFTNSLKTRHEDSLPSGPAPINFGRSNSGHILDQDLASYLT